jgi:hypothetical protein
MRLAVRVYAALADRDIKRAVVATPKGTEAVEDTADPRLTLGWSGGASRLCREQLGSVRLLGAP